MVDGLAGAGLFGALVPADLGGLDLTLPESIELFRAVAEHDASTSWTLSILANGALFGRLLGGRLPRARRRRDDEDRRDLQPADTAAEPIDGGYRLTGTVGYASGCHHADWLMAAAWVERDGDGPSSTGSPS